MHKKLALELINKEDKRELEDTLKLVGMLDKVDIVQSKNLLIKTLLRQQKLQILVKQVTLIYMI